MVVTAAQLRSGPFKTEPMEDVRATMESKFWGAWCVWLTIVPGGSLTLVSDFLSIRLRPAAAIVGATNSALELFAIGLALELAPVRVNAVSPGTIDTPISVAMPDAASCGAAAGATQKSAPASSSMTFKTGNNDRRTNLRHRQARTSFTIRIKFILNINFVHVGKLPKVSPSDCPSKPKCLRGQRSNRLRQVRQPWP